MSIKIISEKPITMGELKREIEKIEAKDKELNFRAGRTKEYLNNFVTLDEAQEKDLKSKLEALNIPRMKEEHITKIIDILPQKIDGLKVLLQQFTITISNENMKKIMDTIVSVSAKKEKKEK